METYKLARLHALGGPEVLQIETAPIPTPGAGEVLLRMLSIGVTQGDAMYRRGTYLEKPTFPTGIGTEVCGVVEVKGAGVSNLQVSDRVSSLSTFSINRYPAYGEYAVLPATALWATPRELTDHEGAAYRLAFVSMYLALIREARLKVGEWVLLTAAASTTALAAAQIAQMAGARVIGVVRGADKAEALGKEPGFTHVLTEGPTLAQTVQEMSGGGVQVILDPVLGPASEALGGLCGRRARIVHYGALAGPAATHSIYHLAPKFLSVQGFTIYGYSGSDLMNIPRDEPGLAEAEAFVAFGVAAGALRPKVARVFKLDDVVEAHRALETGRHIGKIVLEP